MQFEMGMLLVCLILTAKLGNRNLVGSLSTWVRVMPSESRLFFRVAEKCTLNVNFHFT